MKWGASPIYYLRLDLVAGFTTGLTSGLVTCLTSCFLFKRDLG